MLSLRSDQDPGSQNSTSAATSGKGRGEPVIATRQAVQSLDPVESSHVI